ncbi:glutamate racemase [Terrimonas sp.]|uniref:glutamate racemase n=1 Tax=Terrimonas sp. TaxID=1914338 RepID=UPI000D517E3D|nr:glutamate racemase [Terrimonas sp.]PVD49520.1 glutamate racemase [Terrimonas sp.]
MNQQPIGVFDSGYGGLTVLKEIIKKLPQYDYVYLGDNARAPYGTRSFESVYHYTLECVQWLFNKGCPLVILACNTASAKALRTIQQNDLPKIAPGNRVLGVIRPTTEKIGDYTQTKQVGILATAGTVLSESYIIETNKFYPGVTVFQQACPMWVPLVENNEHNSKGADYFIEKDLNALLDQSKNIDTILLACTHYPLLKHKIQQFLPEGISLLSQGEIVADSLEDYLVRHPEIEERCSRQGKLAFFTTDSPADFDAHATIFLGRKTHAKHADMDEVKLTKKNARGFHS